MLMENVSEPEPRWDAQILTWSHGQHGVYLALVLGANGVEVRVNQGLVYANALGAAAEGMWGNSGGHVLPVR